MRVCVTGGMVTLSGISRAGQLLLLCEFTVPSRLLQHFEGRITAVIERHRWMGKWPA
jgi:hypothetical protein